MQWFGLMWLFRGVAVGLMAWRVCLLPLQWKAPHQRSMNYSTLLAGDASESSDSDSERRETGLIKRWKTTKAKITINYKPLNSTMLEYNLMDKSEQWILRIYH